MSAYDPPNFNQGDIYNEYDYTSTYQNNTATKIDTTLFVQKSGSVMGGELSVPSLSLYNSNGSLNFPDGTHQTTAFSQSSIDLLNSSNIVHLVTTDITFADSTKQTTAFLASDRTKTSACTTQLTNTTFDSVNNKTSISNNVYCGSLTCGNINTSYLTSLTSNAQAQINALNSVAANTVTTDTVQTITGVKNFSGGINVNGTGQILQLGSALIPVGSIFMFAGNFSPNNYLVCQGQSFSITTMPLLFGAIGYIYGGVTGVSYNLPDLRGIFVRGVGTHGSSGASGLAIGKVQLQSLQTHGHNMPNASSVVNAGNALVDIIASNIGGILDLFRENFAKPFGGGGEPLLMTNGPVDTMNATPLANETRPTNMSLIYMIKVN